VEEITTSVADDDIFRLEASGQTTVSEEYILNMYF